jgi:hypothetical protein
MLLDGFRGGILPLFLLCFGILDKLIIERSGFPYPSIFRC